PFNNGGHELLIISVEIVADRRGLAAFWQNFGGHYDHVGGVGVGLGPAFLKHEEIVRRAGLANFSIRFFQAQIGRTDFVRGLFVELFEMLVFGAEAFFLVMTLG